MGGKSKLSCLASANQADCRQLRVADVQLRGVVLGTGRGIKHIYPNFSRDFHAVPLFTLLSRLREKLDLQDAAEGSMPNRLANCCLRGNIGWLALEKGGFINWNSMGIHPS